MNVLENKFHPRTYRSVYYGRYNSESGWVDRVEDETIGISIRFVRAWDSNADQANVAQFHAALQHAQWLLDPTTPLAAWRMWRASGLSRVATLRLVWKWMKLEYRG